MPEVQNTKKYLDAIEMLGFQVVERLWPACCRVYLVQKDAVYSIIKMGSTVDGNLEAWAYRHVQKEAAVLGRVNGIENIAHKKSTHVLTIQKEYQQSRIAALVKEYIEGKCLRENYDDKGQRIPFRKKQKLDDAVRAIHAAGIASLDLYARNIVVDPSGSPFLIDLGTGQFKEETPKRRFQSLVSADLTCLERLLKREVILNNR